MLFMQGMNLFLYEDRIYVYSDAQYYSHKWIIRYVVKDINRIYEDIQEAKNRSTEIQYIARNIDSIAR